MMPISRRRLIVLAAVLTTWSLIVVCRLFQIQVVRHAHYETRAAKQQERTITLAPVRGSILDRERRVLAESVVAQSIYADPQSVTDAAATARALAAFPEIGQTAKEVEKKLRGRGEFAWIARQLEPEAAQWFKAL